MTLIRSLTIITFCAVPLLAADAAPDAKQIFDRQLSNTEGEVVGLAEAMPADKFNFAPTNGEFTGVRTFALQVRHIAYEINVVASAFSGKRARLPAKMTMGRMISTAKTRSSNI